MEQSPDPFDRIPDEVFQLIFGAIHDCKTLVRCMAVSRAFRAQSIRVPSLSIVCPGTFSSYDAKLKGVYMMVKEFSSLEYLVVRVGQPKEEPPTWARCMRYAEIGTSVEKFVFMAAKSGDFSEFDVEVAETEEISDSERSSSFDRQREQSWEMWREQLLLSGRARLARSEDESDEDVGRRHGSLGGSAGALHLEMDNRAPSTSFTRGSTETSRTLEIKASSSGADTSLQLFQANVTGDQHTATTIRPEQEGSTQGHWIATECPDMGTYGKLEVLQDDASSSNLAARGMVRSSENWEEGEMGGTMHEASTSQTDEPAERFSSHQGQPRPQAERADDPLEVPSPDLTRREWRSSSARNLYPRRFSGHGRHSYEGWDFVSERCRLPDFVLRQVIAPSNDVLKRMVPVIVFAIVQGLDEFRDSVPSFIAKFGRLKRFVLVDMVESVTVYMREHHIKEIRDQGVPEREGLRESRSSGRRAGSEKLKTKYSVECKKVDNRNPDVRDVENLPDFPLIAEGTSEGEKGKVGKRRISGKVPKDSRMKGIDLRLRALPDSALQKPPMSEDDLKDCDIRRWKGKGIVSFDETANWTGLPAQEVRNVSEDRIVDNQAADTTTRQAEMGVPKCASSSDLHAPQSRSSASRLFSDPPAVDYSSDVSDISLCISCGWANDQQPCQSRDCPRHLTQSTTCKQHDTLDTDSRLNFECDGSAGVTCQGPSENYISLKDVTFSNRAYASVSVEGPSNAYQPSTAPVTNDYDSSRDEEYGAASSSSNFVDKSDSDVAHPGHGVPDGSPHGGATTESGSESEKKERPWFQYFVGLPPGGEVSEGGHVGGDEDTSLPVSPMEGHGDISRQAVKKVTKLENHRALKDSRKMRRSREDIRGFSVRRSHRMTAERSTQRVRLSCLPARLMGDHADDWGGPSVDSEIRNSGVEQLGGEEVEDSGLRVEEALESETPDCDQKSMKGKQVMDEYGCSPSLLGSSSTWQARSSSLMSSSYGQESSFTTSFGHQGSQEQGGQVVNAKADELHPELETENFNQEALGSPAQGLGEASLSRSDSSRLGWFQFREATRADRPRVGFPPSDRLLRDRSNDRDTWRDRVRRRARDHRRDGEADRDRRERMRDGAWKRQRDIETEALYFDISFWRTEQVVAQNYCLSDVSMCVATHCARALTMEELDILSRAALAGPLLTATIGYVNKQVGSHNL